MAIDIGTLLGHIEIGDRFSSNIDLFNRKIDGASEQFTRVGTKMTSAGRTMSAAFTLPVLAAGTASAVLAGRFEDITQKLVSLAGVSQHELAGVRHELLEMAPAVGIGPVALATAMTKVSSTMSDTKVAMEVLKVAARGSAAGMGEAVDVAGALTAVINAYGPSMITASRAGDILTQTIKEGGAEARELAPTLANVVPFAAQLGITFDQVGANIATVTKLGVPAAEAVTQLSAAMTAVTKESSEGTDALASVNLTYAAIRKTIREDGLLEAIKLVTDKFGDNTTALTQVFGRVEALRNVLSVSGAQAEVYAKTLDKIRDSAGSLDTAFAMMKGTQTQTWKELSATIQVIAIRFGDALAPSIAKVMQSAQPLLTFIVKAAEGFAKLPTPIQTTAIALVALTATLGPMFFAIGSITNGVGTVLPLFTMLTRTTTTLSNTIPVLTARVWLLDAAQKATRLSTIAWSATMDVAKVFANDAINVYKFFGETLFKFGNTIPVLTARVWLLDTSQKAASLSAAALRGVYTLFTTTLFIVSNSVPVLTARVWLLDTSQKAAALSATAWGAALKGVLLVGAPIIALFGAVAYGMVKAAESIEVSQEKSNKAIERANERTKNLTFEVQAYDFYTEAATEKTKAQTKAFEDAKKPVDALTDSMKNLKEQLSGAEAGKSAAELNRVFSELKKEGPITREIELRVVRNAKMIQDAGGGAALDKEIQGLVTRYDELAAATEKTRAAEVARTQAMERQREAAKELAKRQDEVNKKIREAQTDVGNLTGEQKNLINSYMAIGINAEDIAIKLGVSGAAVSQYIKSLQYDAEMRQELLRQAQQEIGETTKRIEEDALRLISSVTEGRRAIDEVQRTTEESRMRRTMSAIDFEIAMTHRWADEQKKAFKGASDQVDEYAEAIDIAAKEMRTSLVMDEALRNVDARIKVIVDSFYKIRDARRTLDYEQAVRSKTSFQVDIDAVNAWADEQKKAFQEVGEKAVEYGKIIDRIAAGRILDIQAAKFKKELIDLENVFTSLADIMGDSEDSALRWAATMVSAFSKANEAAISFQKGDWLSGAASGIQAVNQATSSTSRAKNVAGGALTGAKLGASIGTAVLPGIGTAVGAAIGATAGAIVGFIRSLGAGREAVVKFAESFDTLAKGDGFQELHEQLLTLGNEGERLWVKLTQGTGKNDPKAAQKIIEEITLALQTAQETMGRWGLTLEEKKSTADRLVGSMNALLRDAAELQRLGFGVPTIAKAMAGPLNDLIQNTIRAGGKLPEALKPLIKELIVTKQLTEDTARAMLGLAKDGVPSLDEITAAADRYGLKLDDLGPKVQQLRINAAFDQIGKDFTTLEKAGVPFETLMKNIVTHSTDTQGLFDSLTEEAQKAYRDAGGIVTKTGALFEELSAKEQKAYLDAGGKLTEVTTGMRQDIQDLVTKSLQLGLTLPETVRPLIERMIEAGLLTDEFGTKLIDTGRLQWHKPLTESLDDLTRALDDLTTALGEIPGAIEKIGATQVPGITIDVGYRYAPLDPSLIIGTATPRVPVTNQTPPEVTAEAEAASAEPSSVGFPREITLNNTTNLDGRRVAQNQVRYLAGELEAAGI